MRWAAIRCVRSFLVLRAPAGLDLAHVLGSRAPVWGGGFGGFESAGMGEGRSAGVQSVRSGCAQLPDQDDASGRRRVQKPRDASAPYTCMHTYLLQIAGLPPK